MFERFSQEAMSVVQDASAKAAKNDRRADAFDVVELAVQQEHAVARKMLDAGGLPVELLVDRAVRARELEGARAKWSRLENCVKGAVRLSRERRDKNITTGHLFMAACDICRSHGIDLVPSTAGRLAEHLGAYAQQERKAGPRPRREQQVCTPIDRQWARRHLSSSTWRVLVRATKIAAEHNEGIIEPEHITEALGEAAKE